MGKRLHRIGLKEIGRQTLNLGRVGENIHTEVVIDCTDLYDEHPDATAVLKAQPPGGEIYTAETTEQDGCVTWLLTSEELGTAGAGQYQLTFADGEEIIKSDIGGYVIDRSLTN